MIGIFLVNRKNGDEKKAEKGRKGQALPTTADVERKI